MRLKKIKLAGFKSFVDPTTIPINANLIGVVGPNGCGKSNIIDAIRWVMGESSAKHLRGESMADVIFSGSNSRKSVGKAVVELIFENNQGKVPGQYASFSEIAIRRETSRAGTSEYSINRTRCRRKDVTDLFLGTGLGPRAYSIIEQGMVTRVIEAKPEELRGFFEEAAGISKYKERRRETENRIRHTRENLERVEDIRREMDIQLKKLQRQSKAAAKYKNLKNNERRVQAQLLVLRWQTLSEELKEKDSVLSKQQVELDSVIAKQREIEAHIESIRVEQVETNDNLNKIQEKFYSVGAEINRVEQKIQHTKETRGQQQREQQQVNQQWQEASDHLLEDRQLLSDLETQLANAKPDIEAAQQQYNEALAAMREAEDALQNWQQEWQTFSEIAVEPEKAMEIQRSRIQHLEPQIEQSKLRLGRLQSEQQALNETLVQENINQLRKSADDVNERSRQYEQRLEEIETKIQSDRATLESRSVELDVEKGELHGLSAKLESLRDLQSAAEGKHDAQLANWLSQKKLSDLPRLSGVIQVESGWEKAVERVLGNTLAAICVDKLDSVIREIDTLAAVNLDVFENVPTTQSIADDSLLHKIQSEINLSSLIGKVRFAEDISEADKKRSGLAEDETVITRSGVLVGPNWISLINQEGANAGILARAREIESIEIQVGELEAEVNEQQTDMGLLRQAIKDQESERDSVRKSLTETVRERTEVLTELGKKETQASQTENRLKQIQHDIKELEEGIQQDSGSLSTSIKLLEDAKGMTGTHANTRDQLESQQNKLKNNLEQSTQSANDKREALHKLEIENQRINTAFDSTRLGIERLEAQLSQLNTRREELNTYLASDDDPEQSLKEQLEQYLEQQVHVEKDLTTARKVVADLDENLRSHEQKRKKQEELAQVCRQGIEQCRVERQEVIVRRDTLEEKLAESNLTVEQVSAEMPGQANIEEWQEESEKIARRIARLGPINLVAIEEFEEQSERKTYLDKQFDDLVQALTTLEEAIQKIDRETRTRFKETFDKVNTGFQSYFPRLFGGGHAYLELTGNDLLDTGVTVMARPPGKRNSTIHLLSGGEKALTAVALIFSIFQLNPAPFCLLDEVDAPLDDANVERYTETLKQLSAETQLLYVTHNKITMEAADLLLGVTMSEPGVSRLVAVDVEEALEMVV